MGQVFVNFACLLVAAALNSLAVPAQAQTGTPAAPGGLQTGEQSTAPVASSPHKAAAAQSRSQPTWQKLTPAQQQALRPLAGNWHELPEERKRKWLEISRNYHALPPAEQAMMHSRMSEWVSLSQQQRTQARLNFVETKKLSPQEKAVQWQAYQELSPEEKKKLAAKAPAQPITGAAIVKPVLASDKLTKVPVTRHTPKPENPSAKPIPLQANTLLPQPVLSAPPATTPTATPPATTETSEPAHDQ